MQNFSVEQSLMKAKSYANKGETIEAQKLYETILKNFSNNLRAQQGLAALKKYNVNKEKNLGIIKQLKTDTVSAIQQLRKK